MEDIRTQSRDEKKKQLKGIYDRTKQEKKSNK